MSEAFETIHADVIVIGAGGAGLRSAIAAAQANPAGKVALISKVYPMRSHTVAAEGGAAGVVQAHDSLEHHFNDTVSGGDWLCDQDVVDYFTHHATEEMVQLEHWGCPWSRKDDGSAAVRRFGGMKIERTWYAADKTGFHILHTLFQTSLQYSNIHRFDEFFCTDLIVDDGRCQGVIAIEIKTGDIKVFLGKAIVMATGGAGRVFRFNTNGAIVTGDGMSMAYRAGAALRDMEFVQYHPTGLPGSGVLITEGCRGEGGTLLNRHGYRYLQDYGLGPETPIGKPENKYMELGPRDKLSQAFWHEQRKGNTVPTPLGDAVMLDLTHLGEAKLLQRLPMICSLARHYVGIDPVKEPIPVRPAVHYTMGGIRTDIHAQTEIAGLYAAGECSSIGLHGANRLGSNSLAELLVFGKVAGEQAVDHASRQPPCNTDVLLRFAQDKVAELTALRAQKGTEKSSHLRHEMAAAMEKAFGIYRLGDEMQTGLDTINELKARYKQVNVEDQSRVFNTEFLMTLELRSCLELAQVMATSALHRKESRGAHQRLDDYKTRDDENYLKHTLMHYSPDGDPILDYEAVNITRSQPRERAYGAAGEQKNKQEGGS
ncbi:fumarate reductase (quinol) flavoprotein subunit [Marinobacter panjinensis]|uniref:Fumarate reductase flavoprotein subunit n=1 Tax=Marinobacter panjinensis TaxID=2576384 RepID=A0A4U6QW78_9GAMM|nr:fumarate reductase (quinol) flavoprotein subunit [Marinobacter panjinensis]MCR8915017.1 fumarate reductase (quinol) flavoprotein subunit [Marinobacter panjinensis]TKV64256.1 fumarate reductase (quinol) flavoprotein subunit [Marinobacter panjinensis]